MQELHYFERWFNLWVIKPKEKKYCGLYLQRALLPSECCLVKIDSLSWHTSMDHAKNA